MAKRKDSLDANNNSCPILQPVGQSAVPGQGWSRNMCLGGSCRGIMRGEGDLTAPCPRERGTAVGGDGGHPFNPPPLVQLCLGTVHTHNRTQTVQGHRRMVLGGAKLWFLPSPRGDPLPQGPPPGMGSLSVLANPTARSRWSSAWLEERGGVEQSGFVWCNPPELLPTRWG